MKKIKLTQNKYALVDNEDFKWLNQWKWEYESKGYAVIRYFSSQKIPIKMHRLIMGAKKNQIIDHKDGNGLNNQRKNLRFCTHSENMRNQKIPKNNTSGQKGVCWHKRDRRWTVAVCVNNKIIHLGYFIDKEKATVAYKKGIKKYYGQFAREN